MKYTANIDDPAEGLDQILSAASKFDSQRFLYALDYKNWNEKQMERMSKEVSESTVKLEKEYNRLVEFAQVFNKEFATDDNKCYNSALALLKKLRSGISETKKIFMKFCPRARKDRFYQSVKKRPASAYDYSYISRETYQMDIFLFEGYPACVNGLCDEIEKFFLVRIRCMQLCKQVLSEEQKIKNDNAYCKYLLKEFKEKVLSEISGITMIFSRDSEYLTEEKNQAIASRNHYDNDDAWAPVGFHNYSKKEVKLLIIKQVLDTEEGSDLTRMERLLFGDDEQTVHKYRYIIQHFDELIPESYHRKKLPAKYIQMFFQFVGITYKKELEAYKYFKETYLSSTTHNYTMVTYQAVNDSKKEVLEEKDGAYKAFVLTLRQRFYATIPLPQAVNY